MTPIKHYVKNDPRPFYRITPVQDLPSGTYSLHIQWDFSIKETLKLLFTRKLNTCIRVSKQPIPSILMELE